MKNYRQQQSRPKKKLLVAGREKLMTAIAEGQQFDKIYLQGTAHGDWVNDLRNVATAKGIPVQKVPPEKLNSFNISNHGGCIGQLSIISYTDLQDIISFTVENGEVPLFLILDGVTDIRNIGGIARSAFCFGVQALIIPDKGVGALNEDAILTSAGALEQLAVCRVQSLMKAVDDLHLNGIKVYASDIKAKTPLSSLSLNEPCAIIMGGEEKGIYPVLLKICDEQFKIPMSADFDSLNVSVAAGICLYEAAKQRGA